MSSNNADLSHDVVFEASDGLKLGVMLSRSTDEQGQQGAKAWRVEEIPTPSNVRVTLAGVGVSDQPPEMQAVVFRDDNSGGMGAQNIAVNETFYRSGVVATSVAKKIVKPPGHEEITLPTSEGKVGVWFAFGGATYVSDGRYLHRSADGSTFTQVMDAGVSNIITAGQPFGASDGDTGIVVGVAVEATLVPVAHWYSTDGTTFAQVTDDASRRFNKFAVQDDTLFGFANRNEMRTTSDPFTATPTWGGLTQVGDELHKFQDPIVVSGVLVIPKEDRVFTVNAAGTVETLVGQFAPTAGPRNFESTAIGMNSNVYWVVGRDVWEYDPIAGTLRPLGAARLVDSQFDSSFTGKLGLTYDPEGALFTTHFTNLDSDAYDPGASLLRITFSTIDRDVYQLPKAAFERWLQKTKAGAYRPQGPMFVSETHSTLTTGRHLFFNTATAGKVGRMDLWRAADPTLDTISTYDITASIYRSGWMHHNFPTQVKDYTSFKIDLQGVTGALPGASVDVYYYLDGDITTRYTLQTGLDISRIYTIDFTGQSSRAIMIELILHSDTDTRTPEVLSWAVTASVKFDFREIMNLGVKVGDHVLNRRGARSEYNASTIRSTLKAFREREGITVDYKDYRGYHFTNVRVLPGFREVDGMDENGQVADYTVLNVRVMRVSEDEVGAFIVDSSLVGGPDLVVEG